MTAEDVDRVVPSATDGGRAAPDTLLGMLQRGRGEGFLRALRERPEDVHALLVRCVTVDSRWSSQVEPRGDYYAQLMLATGMDLAPLARHLRDRDDPDQHGWSTPLTVETLGALARRGAAAAVEILRDYVAWGQWYDWVLDDLAAVGDAAWRGLDAVLCERFADDDDLYYALDLQRPLWPTWERSNPRIARLLAKVRADERKRERAEADQSIDLERPVGDALAAVTADFRPRFARIGAALARRASRNDAERHGVLLPAGPRRGEPGTRARFSADDRRRVPLGLRSRGSHAGVPAR